MPLRREFTTIGVSKEVKLRLLDTIKNKVAEQKILEPYSYDELLELLNYLLEYNLYDTDSIKDFQEAARARLKAIAINNMIDSKRAKLKVTFEKDNQSNEPAFKDLS